MSNYITLQDRVYHDAYCGLPPAWKATVDECFREVRNSIERDGLKAASDDRAEALIAALTRYLEDSNESEAAS